MLNISRNTIIGKENKIFPFVSINDPQDLKYNGEASELIIGENNVIREHVTINPGTEGGGMLTKVGDGCLIMVPTWNNIGATWTHIYWRIGHVQQDTQGQPKKPEFDNVQKT